MGKFDGKHLTGLVGNTVSRKGKNGITIVQSAPAKVQQTRATKQASGLFGLGSTLAKVIREDLNTLISDRYDGDMINRLGEPVRQIIRQCYHKETKKFSFTEDSFSRLAGAEFNSRSPLINSLWVSPGISLVGNLLGITLPEIKTGTELKFPRGANTCVLTIAVTRIALEPGLHQHCLQQTLEISTAQQLLPAQEFTFEVPDGCLCVVGIGLSYFSLHNNIKTVMNSKTFNPAGICGALVIPGTFVKPPREITPHGTNGSSWPEILKLRLPG